MVSMDDTTAGGEADACTLVRTRLGTGAVVCGVPPVVDRPHRRCAVLRGAAGALVAHPLGRGGARRAVRPGRDLRGGVPQTPARAEGAAPLNDRGPAPALHRSLAGCSGDHSGQLAGGLPQTPGLLSAKRWSAWEAEQAGRS